jgi:hypothetical protein
MKAAIASAIAFILFTALIASFKRVSHVNGKKVGNGRLSVLDLKADGPFAAVERFCGDMGSCSLMQ